MNAPRTRTAPLLRSPAQGSPARPSLSRRSLSRRGLLAGAGSLGVGGLLAACGDSDGSSGSGDSGDSGDKGKDGAGKGGWSFKDDRGETATSDGVPKRIVAYIGAAAALHDLGVECTGVFGPTKLKNGDPDIQAGGVDVDKVTIIGNSFGKFNVEKYASLRPEVLITTMNVSPELWYVPEESAEEIKKLAPTVGILTGKTSLTAVLARFQELAASLGADLKAERVTKATSRFEAAAEALRKAAKAKKGLKVMAVSAQPDLLYVGTPGDFTDLRYYGSLGVEFVTPAKTAPGGFFQELSWERANMYDADLILVDRRTGNLQPADLKKTKPTWAALPAVRAGQVVQWYNEAQFSHAGFAPHIEALAKGVQKAKKVS